MGDREAAQEPEDDNVPKKGQKQSVNKSVAMLQVEDVGTPEPAGPSKVGGKAVIMSSQVK